MSTETESAAAKARSWGSQLLQVAAIVLAVLLVGSAMRAVFSAQDRFGLLLSVGLVTMLAFHMIVNIGMTIGIMPITGIPLPFVSYGGSAVFADMIAIGLLQSVHRRRTVFE